MVQTRHPAASPAIAMSPDDVEPYLKAAAAALSLPLPTEYLPGVKAWFEQAAIHAQLIDAVELEPHHESAATFEPVSSGDAS